MAEFKEGDLVQHIAGGPPMGIERVWTVDGLLTAACSFPYNGKEHKKEYAVSVLKHYKHPEIKPPIVV